MSFARKVVILAALSLPLWLLVGIILYRLSPKVDEIRGEDKIIAVKYKMAEKDMCREMREQLNPGFWKTMKLPESEIPQDIINASSTINVHSQHITVDKIKLYYRFSKPLAPKNKHIDVLLLHGQMFTSATWQEVGTLQKLAAFGYYAVAVDLPGFGMSQAATITDKAKFLDNLISALKLRNPVVIAPSMAGSYAIPHIIKYWEKVSGYIPVSPVATELLKKIVCKERSNYSIIMDDTCADLHTYFKTSVNLDCIKVPVLVIFGEKDKHENSAILCYLPWSQAVEIPLARHPAYMDNPPLWHKLLYNYLDVLNDVFNC